MIDERAYELLCCQLGLANEEKAGLRKQVNELIARLKAIEESNKENSKALVDTINDLKESLEKQSSTVEHYRKEMELMRKQLEAKDEVNMMLANEISNLRLQLEDSRKHRFGRTSEQRRLLNNRNIDKSAMEKSEYDGSGKKGDDDNKTDGNGTGSNTSSGNVPAQNCRPSRKKETAPRAAKTRLKVDKVIVHEIEDYYQLPDGARLMKRNGMADVWEYRFIEHVRAHNVEHVYKVARVKLADGTFTNTMEHPLKNLGGIFSPDLLARLLCLKYDFSMPENRQIRLLAREGIHISNTTLNGYIHNGISRLREFMEDVFKEFVQQAKYLFHHKVIMMMQDAKIMANELMRKAANYTINQWKSLRNILKDGLAEISNNLCEQRMKPVKLLLKNCMNIGSEAAAENSAFIFSLIESCKLNDIDPQDYLKHLFECSLHGKVCDKKALCPIFINWNVKTKIFSCGHFYFISCFSADKIVMAENSMVI